jgi:hypothetical protein
LKVLEAFSPATLASSSTKSIVVVEPTKSREERVADLGSARVAAYRIGNGSGRRPVDSNLASIAWFEA